ncbi:MAG: recombinase family protein [bacterium]|nr:recombinase family protein [bacterium]
MSTRTIAYVRVSTAQQATEGVSLAAQHAKVRAYADLYDLDLVGVQSDAGVSAKTLDRPGLQSALSLLATGHADALLVVKLDRLTRSVRDLDTLLSQYFAKPDGPALLSVSENIDTRSPAGRLVLNVLAAVSQWEREAISDRTREALAHKRANGEYTGGKVPYGKRRRGSNLVDHAEEQATIAMARDLRASGLSLRLVGAALSNAGRSPRRGGPWAAVQIRRMLA